MAKSFLKARRVLVVLAILALISGCKLFGGGGGGSSSASSSTVEGVTTPSSVSVVTATNAN
jgi:hypothetical protein